MNEKHQRATHEPEAAVCEFLQLLARDIDLHPERLRQIDSVWVENLQAETRGVTFDLDQPLSPEDE